MTNVLIVDDERLICQGIASMLHRLTTIDIDQVDSASTGAEAFRLFMSDRPDIVITDIRMPGMDGLELMRQIRKIDQEVPIVVLSGYAEFDFVKQAFLLGAVDYLLKPVTIDELERVIGRIQQDQEQMASSDADQMQEKEQYRRAVLDNFLHRVFSWRQQTLGSLIDQEKEIAILLPYECFTLVQFKTRDKASSSTIEKISQSVLMTLSVHFDSNSLRMHRFMAKSTEIVYLLNFSCENYFSQLVRCFEQVAANVTESSQRIFAAISSCQDGIGSLDRLYEQAEKAMAHKILYPEGTLLNFSSVSLRTDRTLLDPSMVLALKAALRARNRTQFYNIIDELFLESRFDKLSIQSLQDLYASVTLAVNEVYHDQSGQVSEKLQKDFFSFSSLSDLRIYIKDEVSQLFFDKDQNNQTSLILLIKKYIEANYSQHIDMSTVAEAFSMSYSYFSKYFKDEAGMNFSDYLNRTRMEAAKRLLDDPTFKVYEAAQRVGIDNAKYFTRLFHQYYGISPKAYQQKSKKKR